MAFLDEVSPRGWSMKFGHRRRLVAAAHGAADKKWGRSTVKRSVNRGRRLDDAWEDKNKSHRWRGSKVVFITVLVGNLAKARSFFAWYALSRLRRFAGLWDLGLTMVRAGKWFIELKKCSANHWALEEERLIINICTISRPFSATSPKVPSPAAERDRCRAGRLGARHLRGCRRRRSRLRRLRRDLCELLSRLGEGFCGQCLHSRHLGPGPSGDYSLGAGGEEGRCGRQAVSWLH